MRRKFQSKISTFWTWVSWALIILVAVLYFVSCKTIQRDKDIYVPTITQEQTDYLDSTLAVLNSNSVEIDRFKPLNPRTGKPFTWWQRNVSGTGNKYKNIYINSYNKDKSKDKSDHSTNVKAKGSAVANTGDSANIAAAPMKAVNKGRAVEVKGDGNKVTTRGGTPLWVWLVGLGLVVLAAYKFVPSFRKLLPF